MKIYTKTGDKGTTGLGGGQRLPKDAVRIEAYGTTDELGSVMGLVLLQEVTPASRALLQNIQHELFVAGGDLCILPEDQKKWFLINSRHYQQSLRR